MIAALFLPFAVVSLVGSVRIFWQWARNQAADGSEPALRSVGLSILLLGSLTCAWLYRTGSEDPGDRAIAYELDNGVIRPVLPGESKRYARQMELLGGKAMFVADDVLEWWHSRSPAYLLGAFTVAAALTCLSVDYVQRRNEPPPDDGDGGADDMPLPPLPPSGAARWRLLPAVSRRRYPDQVWSRKR